MPNMNDPASLWHAILGRLQLKVKRAEFDTFLRPCVGHGWEGGCLVVAAPSSFSVSWLTMPEHLAVAEEALSRTMGRNARIVYRPIPDAAGVPVRQEPAAAATEPDRPAAADQCPVHPEAWLRRRTTFPALLRSAGKTGDEIFYCVGDSGDCTWVYSHQLGVFVRPGMEEQTPLNILRAYQQARKELRQTDRVPAGVR